MINNRRKCYISYKFEDVYYKDKIVEKYALETAVWNSSHPIQAQSFKEYYINAETFLKAKGVKIILETMHKLNDRRF